MMMRATLVTLAAIALVACASTRDTAEPPAELQPITTALKVERVWNARLADSGGLRFALRPVVADEHVFVAAADGRVQRRELETGRVVWERRTGLRLTAGPGVGQGIVVVAAENGQVVALNAGDGSERWRTGVTSDVFGVPGVARGVVSVRSGDQVLFGLDAATGEQLWRIDQSVPALTMRAASGVAVMGDMLIAGFANGRVVGAQAADGATVWELPFALSAGRTEIERMVDVAATPQLFGREVFVASYQGQIASVSGDSGRVIWARDFSSTAGLGVGVRGVWATDADSEIWGFDRVTGAERWRQRGLRARHVTAPAVGDGWIAVGDLEGWLHFLDQDTGEFVNRQRVDRSAIHVAPVGAGRMVLVQSGSGTLAAYRVGD